MTFIPFILPAISPGKTISTHSKLRPRVDLKPNTALLLAVIQLDKHFDIFAVYVQISSTRFKQSQITLYVYEWKNMILKPFPDVSGRFLTSHILYIFQMLVEDFRHPIYLLNNPSCTVEFQLLQYNQTV